MRTEVTRTWECESSVVRAHWLITLFIVPVQWTNLRAVRKLKNEALTINMSTRIPTHSVQFSSHKMALFPVDFYCLYWKSRRLGRWLGAKKRKRERETDYFLFTFNSRQCGKLSTSEATIMTMFHCDDCAMRKFSHKDVSRNEWHQGLQVYSFNRSSKTFNVSRWQTLLQWLLCKDCAVSGYLFFTAILAFCCENFFLNFYSCPKRFSHRSARVLSICNFFLSRRMRWTTTTCEWHASWWLQRHRRQSDQPILCLQWWLPHCRSKRDFVSIMAHGLTFQLVKVVFALHYYMAFHGFFLHLLAFFLLLLLLLVLFLRF